MLSRTLICRFTGYVVLAFTAVVSTATQGQGLVSDVKRGQQLVESRCYACHDLDANRTGPALRGVVGRKVGKVAGYAYSNALFASKLIWTEANIKAWLTNPENVVPGQEMNYRLDEAQDREDVVAYLATLSR